MLLCENFDFLYEEDERRKNNFELAKITFANGARCVGVISSRMKDVIMQDFADSEIAFKKSTASSLVASAVKAVKTHHKLLLCGGVLSDWSVIGYIPGFDAEANEAMLGPVSHSDVKFKRGSLDELHHLTMGPRQNVLYKRKLDPDARLMNAISGLPTPR